MQHIEITEHDFDALRGWPIWTKKYEKEDSDIEI